MSSISAYSSNGSTGFSSKMRLTGLSGLDTDSIIDQLMQAERVPLDTLKQKRQLVEWKQEIYRGVSTSLISFKSKFFDIVNRSSYLLSDASVKAKAVKTNSEYFSATASSSANVGSQTVKVLQVATSAKSVTKTDGGVSKSITGTLDSTNLSGKKMIVTLDGVAREIALDNYADATDFETKFKKALEDAFGKSKIKLDVKTTTTGDAANPVNQISFTLDTEPGVTKLTINEAFDSPGTLTSLGLTDGVSNRISLKSSLLTLKNSLNGPELEFDENNKAMLSINGKVFVFNATDTLEKVFETINKDAHVNVTINYNEITDEVTLLSKQTGAGSTLTIRDEEGSNLLAALGLTAVEEGQDAKVEIDNQIIIRNSNNFTVNGVNYSLKKAHPASSDGDSLTVEQDTESVINNIKSFVEEYNKLIDSINGLVKEKYDRNYQPLTDAQKEEMDEKQIEKWEKKAKTGILRGDSILQNITYSMRKALYEKVEGVSITLKDIGIESKSYSDYGKLYVDENKLKEALTNNPDEVAKLLNGTSAQYPTYSRDFTPEQKQVYYNQSGVFRRIASIIEDNVSTTRNAQGYKGILLEKAGIENDLTFTENLLSKELEDYDDRIKTLVNRLTDKEENYYFKFSYLETMISRMNQQSAWLSSQFGG